MGYGSEVRIQIMGHLSVDDRCGAAAVGIYSHILI